MITQSPDVRDPQLALTWSRRFALCPFWCLDAKGGESLGICELCLSSLIRVLFVFFLAFALVGLSVRPKFE